jgi:hypothetical protein
MATIEQRNKNRVAVLSPERWSISSIDGLAIAYNSAPQYQQLAITTGFRQASLGWEAGNVFR